MTQSQSPSFNVVLRVPSCCPPHAPFLTVFVRLSQVLPYVCSSVVVYTDSAAMPDVDRYVRRQVWLALQAVTRSQRGDQNSRLTLAALGPSPPHSIVCLQTVLRQSCVCCTQNCHVVSRWGWPVGFTTLEAATYTPARLNLAQGGGCSLAACSHALCLALALRPILLGNR